MKETDSNYEQGIAVIGPGYWGKNLIRNYNELGVLKLICDKNETILDHFKSQYPEVDVCLAFNDILDREDIQGVVISTPAETHFRLAREAFLAGKHVYVEKPFVLNEKEGEELIALSEDRQLTLMVGNPAREIGWVCECGERLADDLECPECGKGYVKTEKQILPAQ